jgi:hypothetical protein
MIIRHAPTVVPAEGVVLERVLDATYPVWNGGLSRQAYGKLNAAQMKTAWGRHHQRRFALVDGADVLASAAQYDLAAILDQRPVRVCGIGSIFRDPTHRRGDHAQELMQQLPDQAARDGAVMALLFSEMGHENFEPKGFRGRGCLATTCCTGVPTFSDACIGCRKSARRPTRAVPISG